MFDDRFYLQPIRNQTGNWFSGQPIGKNTLGNIGKVMAKKANLVKSLHRQMIGRSTVGAFIAAALPRLDYLPVHMMESVQSGDGSDIDSCNSDVPPTLQPHAVGCDAMQYIATCARLAPVQTPPTSGHPEFARLLSFNSDSSAIPIFPLQTPSKVNIHRTDMPPVDVIPNVGRNAMQPFNLNADNASFCNIPNSESHRNMSDRPIKPVFSIFSVAGKAGNWSPPSIQKSSDFHLLSTLPAG